MSAGARVREKDGPDFDAGFEEAAALLCAWAELRIPPHLRSQLEPEDVVQEVWMRARRGFASYEPRHRTLHAWLVGIAKNVLLEAMRLARSRPSLPGGATTRRLRVDALPDSVTSLTKRVARDEELGRLVETVRALPEPDRGLALHCGLEGLTVAEAAERLGLGYERAAKRWQRVRERLREHGPGRDLLDSCVG